MKKLFICLALFLSVNTFADELNCSYLNHDNTKGKVKILVETSGVELTFKAIKVTNKNCKVKLTPTEITAECEQDGNSVGIIFEFKNGKFEGILMSEKAQVFAQAEC